MKRRWRQRQAAMFDNLMVRSVLGKDAFFIAPGGINATHLADAKAVLSEFDLVLPLELIGRDMWEPLMLRLGWERPRSNSNGEPIGVRYKQNSINDKHHDGLFMKSHSREEIINAQWHNQTLRVRAWRLACSLVHHVRPRDREPSCSRAQRRTKCFDCCAVSTQALFEQQNELDMALHKWVLDTFNDTWGNPAWRVGEVPALEHAQPQMAEPTDAAPRMQLARLLECGLGRLFAAAGDDCNKRANATADTADTTGGDSKELTPRLAGDNSGGVESIELLRQLESGNGTLSRREVSRGTRVSSRVHAEEDGSQMTVYLHMHKSAGTSVRAHNAAPRLCCPWAGPTLQTREPV